MKAKISLTLKLYSLSAICFLFSLITLVFNINSSEAINMQAQLKKARLQEMANSGDSGCVVIKQFGKEYLYSVE